MFPSPSVATKGSQKCAVGEAVRVDVVDAGAIACEEQVAPVGSPGGIPIEGAVVRHLARLAACAGDDAHVPGALAMMQERKLLAGRRPARRSDGLAARVGEQNARLATGPEHRDRRAAA